MSEITNKDNKASRQETVLGSEIQGLNSIEGLLAFGEKLIKSNLVPHKTAADVMACTLMGKELGLGIMTSINHIYSVNGKASPDVHVISSLLLKGGVTWEVLRYYKPCFYYRDNTGSIYEEFDVLGNPQLYQVITTKTPPEQYETSKTQILRLQLTYKGSDNKDYQDIETVIKFERLVKRADGKFKEMSVISRFKWSDAINQKLDGKDNWQKMPAIMLYTRCLAGGGRMIADDLLLGVYEFSEMADIQDIPYEIVDDTAKPKESEIRAEDSPNDENVQFEDVKEVANTTKEEATGSVA